MRSAACSIFAPFRTIWLFGSLSRDSRSGFCSQPQALGRARFAFIIKGQIEVACMGRLTEISGQCSWHQSLRSLAWVEDGGCPSEPRHCGTYFTGAEVCSGMDSNWAPIVPTSIGASSSLV